MEIQKKMSQQPNINIAELFQTAQSMFSSEDKEKLSGMKMDQMFSHVTDTVIRTMEQSGHKVDPFTKNQMKTLGKTFIENFVEEEPSSKESKVHIPEISDVHVVPQKENFVEELNDEEEIPELKPRVDDIYYDLPVTLEEMYSGKTKKLAIKCNRIHGKKIKEEKRKIEIPVVKGVHDGQEIRFNKEGNEKLGHESGDIVVTLLQGNHENFERHGSTLYTVKNISLYESYAAARGDIKIVIKHLDGTYLFLKSENGLPLHAKDGSRKIKGAGMPVFGSKKNEYGDLYIRFNLILPESFEKIDEVMPILEKMFSVIDKNSIYYSNGSKQGFQIGKSDKIAEVKLEEVTEEDIQQIEYDEQEYDDDEEESQYTNDNKRKR